MVEDLPKQILRLLLMLDGTLVDAYELTSKVCCGPEQERPLDLVVEDHDDTAARLHSFHRKTIGESHTLRVQIMVCP